LFGIAILVGFARVIAGVHHISDIAGAIVIVVVITSVAYPKIKNINQAKLNTQLWKIIPYYLRH